MHLHSICTMKWRESESIKLCHGLFGFQQVPQPFRTGWYPKVQNIPQCLEDLEGKVPIKEQA